MESDPSAKSEESGPDTKEAEALAAALNHSAERVQTVWFTFLTFMVYLAIAAGTTTHRMLFLKEPLNLPVLNLKLPLPGFYILTPIIFVVFHFYMLLNLVLLARTAKSFEDALTRASLCPCVTSICDGLAARYKYFLRAAPPKTGAKGPRLYRRKAA
jgi:hypothetical protein